MSQPELHGWQTPTGQCFTRLFDLFQKNYDNKDRSGNKTQVFLFFFNSKDSTQLSEERKLTSTPQQIMRTWCVFLACCHAGCFSCFNRDLNPGPPTLKFKTNRTSSSKCLNKVQRIKSHYKLISLSFYTWVTLHTGLKVQIHTLQRLKCLYFMWWRNIPSGLCKFTLGLYENL